ncbi:hypothetical protein CHS0354_001142, partial [Potamilus streckersoni]
MTCFKLESQFTSSKSTALCTQKHLIWNGVLTQSQSKVLVLMGLWSLEDLTHYLNSPEVQ